MCFSKAVFALLKTVFPVLLKVNTLTKNVVVTHVPSGLLILGVLVNGFRRTVVDSLCFSKLCVSLLKGGFARMFQQSGPDAAFSRWFWVFRESLQGTMGHRFYMYFFIACQIAMGTIISSHFRLPWDP